MFFIQFKLNTGFVYFHTMATCATNAASCSTHNKRESDSIPTLCIHNKEKLHAHKTYNQASLKI